ncbi:hypothetical protein SK128_001296, partial [Halocaridina rubra]
ALPRLSRAVSYVPAGMSALIVGGLGEWGIVGTITSPLVTGGSRFLGIIWSWCLLTTPK